MSQWTPDLIELEHRAKEKARILFFVIDSETRGTAGAIEVAHIAGQSLKHLVLVLHPYKMGQRILNETISNEWVGQVLRKRFFIAQKLHLQRVFRLISKSKAFATISK